MADPKTYIPTGWNDWQGLLDLTTYQVYDYDLNDNGTVVSYGSTESDYQTDVLAWRAVQYLQSRRDNSQPFFLYITPLAPHIEVPDVLALLLETDPLAAFGENIRPSIG